MAECRGLDIGPTVAPLTVRLVEGDPASIVAPGVPSGAVLRFEAGLDVSPSPHAEGVSWVLSAEQVAQVVSAGWHVRGVAVVHGGGTLMAGQVRVISRWTADCPQQGQVVRYVPSVPGATGPAPKLTAGGVSTVPYGEPATVSVVEAGAGVYRLDLGVPEGRRGERGDDGLSPAVAVGADARLVIDGTPTGPALTGPAPTVTAGTTSTLAPGQSATVQVRQTGPGSYALDVGVPRGVAGDGAPVPSGPWPVTATQVAAGQPPTAALTGQWPDMALQLGLPAGPPGSPGPPGAVPTASDYLVVGPGRPDIPSTTSLTASQLAALPVGCEYRSTDGASVGAWRWQRVLTDTLCSRDGWLCTVGDTGFRDVAPLSPYYDRMKTGGSWDRVLILRRVGSSITLDYGFRTSTSEYEPIIWTFTPGWRVFARGEPYSYASSGQSFTPLRLSGDELRVAPGATRDGGAYMGVFSGQSRDPWPVALPGTPHNT